MDIFGKTSGKYPALFTVTEQPNVASLNVSANHRYVETLRFFWFDILYCDNTVFVLYFGLKYLFWTPKTWL